MLLNCDRECRAGRAVAAPPGRRRPRGRGWAGLIRVPGCHFSAGEQQRLQSVQWFGCVARGGGAHGGAWGAVRRHQSRTAEDVPSHGRCLGFAGIGYMRMSNPRPDRRPTLVMAAVQPRVRRACQVRQLRVCDCASTEWSPCAVRRRPRAHYPPRRGKTTMARRAVTAEATAGPRRRLMLRRPWSRWSNGPNKRSSSTLNSGTSRGPQGSAPVATTPRLGAALKYFS